MRIKYEAVDLFSGCGGVSCGLSLAGFKVKSAVEIEKKQWIYIKSIHH